MESFESFVSWYYIYQLRRNRLLGEFLLLMFKCLFFFYFLDGKQRLYVFQIMTFRFYFILRLGHYKQIENQFSCRLVSQNLHMLRSSCTDVMATTKMSLIRLFRQSRTGLVRHQTIQFASPIYIYSNAVNSMNRLKMFSLLQLLRESLVLFIEAAQRMRHTNYVAILIPGTNDTVRH